MSSARQVTPADADILERVEALEAAWDAGRDVLADADPALARAIEELLPRVRERVALGADRTVVALAGSTGSGKSSLLNAVAGAEVARPGVLRPTTSRAVAAVWPGSSPTALLDGTAWDLPFWPLGRLTPTLALLGDRDAFVPRTDLWSIGLTYGAETVVLSGLGHGVPVDPSWKSVAWRINAWLGERRIGATSRRAVLGGN